MSDDYQNVGECVSFPKKRKRFGRVSYASKKIRAQSHELGEDCSCSKGCFDHLSSDERNGLIAKFNELGEWKKQTDHLAGLISIQLIKHRKPRKPMNEANLRKAMYGYKVRLNRNGNPLDIVVCQKAFRSIHGISKKILENIQKALADTGMAPNDMRGKHKNRPHKLSAETITCVKTHIGSFQGRQCHYSLEKSKKTYLSEELNVCKMHSLYKEVYPMNPVSLESYRDIFNKNFNIGFGFPRSDTCGYCDEATAKLKSLNIELKDSSIANKKHKEEVSNQIKKIETEDRVYKLKANTFYDRKKKAKLRSREKEEVESLTMDFQKNLPTPNITTNIVYYKRQLSMYSFNIHRLSDNDVYIYAYPETSGNKGSNEVVSFLDHYVNKVLSPKVQQLEIFCDSCGGQNKNYTLIRYCHYLVCFLKRLKSLKLTFPVVGHSYMECDKDVGLIKTKTRTEVPQDWVTVFKESRVKPAPFNVVEVEIEMIRDWSSFLAPFYLDKCTFATRPIRELRIEQDETRLVYHRESFNGSWVSSVVAPAVEKKMKKSSKKTKVPNETKPKLILPMGPLLEGEFYFPPAAYEGKK